MYLRCFLRNSIGQIKGAEYEDQSKKLNPVRSEKDQTWIDEDGICFYRLVKFQKGNGESVVEISKETIGGEYSCYVFPDVEMKELSEILKQGVLVEKKEKVAVEIKKEEIAVEAKEEMPVEPKVEEKPKKKGKK